LAPEGMNAIVFGERWGRGQKGSCLLGRILPWQQVVEIS